MEVEMRGRVSVWLVVVALAACGGGDDSGSDPVDNDTASAEPSLLGEPCRSDGDCVAGICLRSEYGPPFCTRPCSAEWEPCPEGEDAGAGDTLCVSFAVLPNPAAPPFDGELARFCVPRCSSTSECVSSNESWEACDVPKYLGDPLFPSLGNTRVCQAPSFQGKDPVDPDMCDWEKTIDRYNNEANLCRSYCDYLDRCKELPATHRKRCCEWGCFNAMVIEDEVQDGWFDDIKCYIDTHAAFPDSGPKNACSEPPVECGGVPVDPTPPSSVTP